MSLRRGQSFKKANDNHHDDNNDDTRLPRGEGGDGERVVAVSRVRSHWRTMMGSSANVCCDYFCRHPDYQRSPCSTPRLQTCCTSPPQAWTVRRWRPGSRGKAVSPGQGDHRHIHNAKMKVFEQCYNQHAAGGVYDATTKVMATFMEG